MKKWWVLLTCLLALEIQAIEYEKTFENDHISVAKITILPYEEVGLHRDLYPQLVTALQGGTITRVEVDGRTTDVAFPTGVTVFREADQELHTAVNRSSKAIELMVIQLKDEPIGKQRAGTLRDIAVEIGIDCPMSMELRDFVRSIPTSGNYASGFEEWKVDFIYNMTQLMHLVESEKVAHTFWSVKLGDRLIQELQEEDHFDVPVSAIGQYEQE